MHFSPAMYYSELGDAPDKDHSPSLSFQTLPPIHTAPPTVEPISNFKETPTLNPAPSVDPIPSRDPIPSVDPIPSGDPIPSTDSTLNPDSDAPSTDPPTVEPPPTPSQQIFERVLTSIKEFEYARRQCRIHPRDEARLATLAQAADRVDLIWYHYNAGLLTRECCLLVDLFVAMWIWDSDNAGTSLFNMLKELFCIIPGYSLLLFSPL